MLEVFRWGMLGGAVIGVVITTLDVRAGRGWYTIIPTVIIAGFVALLFFGG